MSSPKCECGGLLAPEVFGGMAVYREEDGVRVYRTRCIACQLPVEIRLNGNFPALHITPFSIGQRWFCCSPGRARFWFVIVGPGENDADKTSKTHKKCRLEVHPEDLVAKIPGYKSHGEVYNYSHKHLKKYATWTT